MCNDGSQKNENDSVQEDEQKNKVIFFRILDLAEFFAFHHCLTAACLKILARPMRICPTVLTFCLRQGK
ncbi:MAG: hypothetical protein H6936_13955 [Burkholderiales bacterium]|nr:hypothetical protein [Nitrosomonas sp.]MCP5275921.1 hypothetical protein [Burkholderiales bacterium]